MLWIMVVLLYVFFEGEYVDVVGCLVMDGGRIVNECGYGNRIEGEGVIGYWFFKNCCKENIRDKLRYVRDIF